ncbi:MAG: hypothetical protein KDD22_05925, partial [Bdellovibrionales bacterium]|nr:hypothetical protein [Bdellovibrionales bacterium]
MGLKRLVRFWFVLASLLWVAHSSALTLEKARLFSPHSPLEKSHYSICKGTTEVAELNSHRT